MWALSSPACSDTFRTSTALMASSQHTKPGLQLPRCNSQVRRKRARQSCSSDREREAPSYNEVLLADKSFHNPNASDMMASSFGIVRHLSFVIDVAADDRNCLVEDAEPPARTLRDEDKLKVPKENSWFYDTVRDRQNQLWANKRIQRGVELARSGRLQVRLA